MTETADASAPAPPPVRVPATFRSTHPTSGLPGFPAVDLFGAPGAPVVLDFGARCERLSGRPCRLGGAPGGAYGLSVYLRRPNGDRYFLTHLTALVCEPGDWLPRHSLVGRLCDSRVTGRPGSTHVHVGRRPAQRA